MFNQLMWEFSFIKGTRISSTKINKKAEILSLWRTPLFSLKYFVVTPPLMAHDSCFFKIISIHQIKFWPNPIFFKTEIKNLCLFQLQSLPKTFQLSNICNFNNIKCWSSAFADVPILIIHSLLCWHYTFTIKALLISLRGLWIIYLYQHLTMKWALSFQGISYLCPFLVNLIIACLWEILKSFFSLARLIVLIFVPEGYAKFLS